ncbi:MAG: alpha/beta hydrolase [Gemmataceae bacterium]
MSIGLLIPAFFISALAAVVGCSPSSKQEAVPPSPATVPLESNHAPESSPSNVSVSDRDASRQSGTPSAQQAMRQSLDEMLLFYPSKYPEGNWKPKGLNFEDVWFEAEDDTRLHGWYCPCDKPRAVFLFAHGNAGNLAHRGWLMQYLQSQLRVTALIFDYRGYGRSEGLPTVEGILQDARAARAVLARRAAVPQEQIVLMGRSLGGAVVVQLAAESPVRGLILESTFSSFKDVARHHFPRLAWLVPASKLDSLSRIKRCTGPLLQSHGDADSTIPYAQGLKLFQAANEPKRWITIPGGDHNSPQSSEYFQQMDRWLDDLPSR